MGSIASCDHRNGGAEEGPGGECEPDPDPCLRALSVAIASADGPLPDSSYEVAIELGDHVYITVCGSSAIESGGCEPVEGPEAFEVAAGSQHGGIFIEITERAGQAELPESVHIVVDAGDAQLVDDTQLLHYREPDDFEPCADVHCRDPESMTFEVPPL